MGRPEKHWDTIFNKTKESDVGWFESDTSKTWELLNLVPNISNLRALLPGVGRSKLIDELLGTGMELIVNDISPSALEQLRERLDPEACRKVKWLVQDISKPLPHTVSSVDIWVDRAVLHFLTKNTDISGYFGNLKKVLNKKGYVAFAEFSENGAERCANLPVHRYSVSEFMVRLGSAFNLISQFEFEYINPSGDSRPYVYALFQKD